MLNKIRLMDWSVKALVGIFVFLLVCVTANFIVRSYFIGTIEKNWNTISSEKEISVKNECQRLFELEQNNTVSYADQLIHNKKILNSFAFQNSKKLYEAFYETPNFLNYNTEFYNLRLETIMFSGRQVYPEISELQRSLSGEKFTVVRENGFYRYLIAFVPIKVSETDSVNKVSEKISGVLVVASQIDANYNIQNIYFKNYGLTKDIENKFDLKVTF